MFPEQGQHGLSLPVIDGYTQLPVGPTDRSGTGVLAQTVGRGVDMGGAPQDGGQGIGRGQAEVVVGVNFQFQRTGTLECAENLAGGERIEQPHGISKAKPPGPGPLGHGHHPGKEVRIGPGAVFTHDADRKAQVQRLGGHGCNALQHPGPVAAEFADNLLIRNGYGKINGVHAQVPRRRQVVIVHTTPHHQPGGESELRYIPDIFPLLRSHGGNTYLKLRNSGLIQAASYGSTLVQSEGNTGSLLAISQGGVMDRYRWKIKTFSMRCLFSPTTS